MASVSDMTSMTSLMEDTSAIGGELDVANIYRA